MFSGSSCSHTSSWRRIARDEIGQRRLGERIQLLHAGDRHRARVGPPLVQEEVHRHLAAAEHQPRHLFASRPGVGVVDDLLEGALGQVARRGPDGLVSQQALGRQDDQRQRIALEERCLSPEDVEVLRRRRAVHQPKVDVGRGLEEPFGAGARVLRALAFIAVGQQ
jgi:hypothetical protein